MNKVSIITGLVAIVIAVLGFMIIYRDITTVPRYNKTFVYFEGSKTYAI